MDIDTALVDRFTRVFNPSAVSIDRMSVTVVTMIGLDILWWITIYTGIVPMPGMKWLMKEGIPIAAPGAMELAVFHVGTLDAVAGYIMMWGVMMWAMMYPAMTRFTREYAAAHRGPRLAATMAVVAFLTSYQIVWALSGVLPLVFHTILPGGIYGFTRTHTHLVVSGGLVLTGLYQLSPLKLSHLRTCCARIEPHKADVMEAFKEGFEHGVTCVLIGFGPFFLLMPFFGEMNFFWMAVLTGVVTIERLPEWGRELAIASGIVGFLIGLLIFVLRPPLPLTFIA